MRRLLAIALLGLTACSVTRPAQEDTGEQIYTALCVNCHGPNLAGGIGPPLGPGSNSARQPDEFLRFAIVEGRGRMPSFSTVLNDQQVEELISYIREVQQG
jgi:mono/diheme cytochrome c family protein